MAVDQDLVRSIDALEAVCLAELFRAFREPIRIRIPSIFDMACVSVGSIVVATQPRHLAVSYQLRILRDAELVRTDRPGAQRFYCATSELFGGALEEACVLANERTDR